MKSKRTVSDEPLDWVQCDICDRWDLFDNCKVSLGMVTIEEVLQSTEFKCDLCLRKEDILTLKEKLDTACREILTLKSQSVQETVIKDLSAIQDKTNEHKLKLKALPSVLETLHSHAQTSKGLAQQTRDLKAEISAFNRTFACLEQRIADNQLAINELSRQRSTSLIDFPPLPTGSPTQIMAEILELRTTLDATKHTLTSKLQEHSILIDSMSTKLTLAEATSSNQEKEGASPAWRGGRRNEAAEEIEVLVKEKVESALRSNEEKEKRKLSAMLYNFPEQCTADGKEDETNLLRLLNHDIGLSYNDCKETKYIRLGSAHRPRASPRPIKITFTTYSKKYQFLNQIKQLKRDLPDFALSAAPDRSPEQREIHNRLIVELKNRREQGESNIAILQGQIVKLSADSNPHLSSPNCISLGTGLYHGRRGSRSPTGSPHEKN